MIYWRFASIPEVCGKDAEAISEIRRTVSKRSRWKLVLLVLLFSMIYSNTSKYLRVYATEIAGDFGPMLEIVFVVFIAMIFILPIMNHIHRAEIRAMEIKNDVSS